MHVKLALESWMNKVFNLKSRTFEYYDDYTKDIEIYLLNKTGNEIHKVTLREAYPINMGEIQLDYNGGSNIVKIPVTIVYKWWESSWSESNGAPGSQFVPFAPTAGGQLNPGNAYYGNKTTPYEYLNSESQGMFTGATAMGGVLTNNPDSYLAFSPNGEFYGQMREFSSSVQQTFAKAGNELALAYDLSEASTPNAGVFIEDMKIYSKAISRDMTDYSQGLFDIASNINSLQGPAGLISNSMFGLSGTLSAIDGTLTNLGINNSPFTKVTGKLNQVASQLGVANMDVSKMASGISSIGANLLTVGSIFSEVNSDVKTRDGFTPLINKSLQNMSQTFSINGSNTMNSANALSKLFG